MSVSVLLIKSKQQFDSSEYLNNLLPPKICINAHKFIKPEQIQQGDIDLRTQKHCTSAYRLSLYSTLPASACPTRYPIILQCVPESLNIELNETAVLKKLRIINSGSRFTSFHISGLNAGVAHLAAHWWCYPRTNFLLAPGIGADIFIKVAPKSSILPHATAVLQLAAGLKRDIAIGYVNIDINVEFMQYSQHFKNTPEPSSLKGSC